MGPDRPQAAFIFSLIAGALILLGSIAMALMISAGYWWMGMSGGHYMMMGGAFSLNSGLMYVLVAFGTLRGVMVLIASIMLNNRPRETTTWGAIILAFSILSFVGMGGYFVGAFLGIIGGVLAITWREPEIRIRHSS